jgi:nucleoside-diphosphate-sugar epimerase
MSLLDRMKLAITGATGFVGARLVARAVDAGHEVAALTRKPQPERENIRWVRGALDEPAALAALVEGADAVIHVAGVVNARDHAGFVAGNIEGTRAILAAAEAARVRHFVHVSSLAAREPSLSNYGSSKAEAERLVRDSALDCAIVRPPAIYGPGDMEMRDMFRIAQRGVVLLPPRGRLSILHVDDLDRLLLVLAAGGGADTLYEVDDGRHWTYAEFGRAIGAAVGRSVQPIHLPAALLRLAATIDGKVRGDEAKLTPDRVGYLVHPDWTATPSLRPPPHLWTPHIPAAKGLAETAAWYRAHGLL